MSLLHSQEGGFLYQMSWQIGGPYNLWFGGNTMAPHYQRFKLLPLKLLGQPCSSSYTERNWSTYKFIHSLKRNKMALTCAKDLVYVHFNLWLLWRHNEEYINVATKTWNIARDSWNDSDIHGGDGILENATLTLDELEWEAMVTRNASTSVTTSESEVRSEAIDLDDADASIWLSCWLSFILF